MEENGFCVDHIAEPFPQVYEFCLSRYPERIILFILPDGRGGFCGAYHSEKLKGAGEHPRGAVMALRKYLGGARLDRLLDRRGEVVFSAARVRHAEDARELPDNAALTDVICMGAEERQEEIEDNDSVYCAFSRRASPALLVNGKQIINGNSFPVSAQEELPTFAPGADDAALRRYFSLCQTRLLAQIDARIRKQTALIERVRLDQKEYARHEEISRDGELLKAQLRLVKRGMREVELTDYFADAVGDQSAPPARRVVALDPLRTPQENVAGIFQRAAKYRRGLAALDKRMQELEAALRALQTIRAEAGTPAYPDFALLLPYIRRFAPPQARDSGGAQKSSQKPITGRSLPYRVFNKEETIIWVGKNAKANALISLKLAAGNDLWFHVKNYPGSHVILRRRHKGYVFTEREIMDAALLALYYSEARSHAREEVLYTEAKHLRAVPGASAGTVHAAAARTITVTLDEARLAEARRSQNPDT
ncbi:MAG: NFACT RNA binding domain-containing protein [Spirochaetota bacterium]|nr:NFACT RNA binding domain-containing protein [Spirochaetota bacterium]